MNDPRDSEKRLRLMRDDLVHLLETASEPVAAAVDPGTGMVWVVCPVCDNLVVVRGRVE